MQEIVSFFVELGTYIGNLYTKHPNTSSIGTVIVAFFGIFKTKIGRRLLDLTVKGIKKNFTNYLLNIVSQTNSILHKEIADIKSTISELTNIVMEHYIENNGKYDIVIDAFKQSNFLNHLEFDMNSIRKDVAKKFPFNNQEFSKLSKRLNAALIDVYKTVLILNFQVDSEDIISKFETEIDDMMSTKNFKMFNFQSPKQIKENIIKFSNDFCNDLKSIKHLLNGKKRDAFKTICLNYTNIIQSSLYRVYDKEKT